MDISILVIEGCPHAAPAAERLQEALDVAGLDDVVFTTEVVGVGDDPIPAVFGGSPTFVIDGVDPFAGADVAPDLACRVYATPSGPQGVPTVGQLVTVLG